MQVECNTSLRVCFLPVKSHGSFKISTRARSFEPYPNPLARSEQRTQRILESLRHEIIEGGGGKNLRIRQVFQSPREIYRLELELPELGYQRTILLDREALEELLELDEIRAIVSSSPLGH
jgi:hypothetical protein